MPKRELQRRPAVAAQVVRGLALPAALLVLLGARAAGAEFAEPPASPYRLPEPERVRQTESDGQAATWRPPSDPPLARFRFHVGPALLIEPTSPGLFTALDIGQDAVGARLSAAWLRADSQQGLSAYGGELWIDFRHRYDLHPIVGAGASFLHGAALGKRDSAGAGTLRGALEYELPIVDADARLSLELMAFVPAIGTERSRPWAMSALMVGAGF